MVVVETAFGQDHTLLRVICTPRVAPDAGVVGVRVVSACRVIALDIGEVEEEVVVLYGVGVYRV